MMRYLLTLILTLSIATLSAERKSVGVVMSGGGAKGLYHIGVLEALEERGVPIDYVAGTSMGAIIAGLYAAGYSPAEMREIAQSGDLETWVTGRIDANYGALFRQGSTLVGNNPTFAIRIDAKSKKSRSEKSVTNNDIAIGSDNKAKIPKSLISTTQIDMAMSRLFTPASTTASNDFDQLMVPFLCVASDVAGRKKVVMREGDLGESIRASMAIPLAFKPIMRDTGEILYDGGIEDNFPWKPLDEAFNPDVIIGSACGGDVDSWADSDNMSLLDQAFLLSMNKTDYTLPENGVIIQRDVPIGMLDFSDSSNAINLGYADTMQSIDEIKGQLGDGQQPVTEAFYTERREAFRDSQPELIFDSYDITGLNPHQEAYVERYISNTARQQRFGAKREREMDFTNLRRSLYSVLSTGDYTTNFPIITYDSISSRFNFSIELEHKPQLELSLGGNLSSTPFNQLYIGAKYTSIERVAKSLFTELSLGPLYSTGRVGYRVDFYHTAPVFIDTYFNFAVKNLNHGNFGHLTPIDNAMDMKSSDYLMSLGIGAPIMQRSQIILRGNGGVEEFEYNTYDYELVDETPYAFDKSRFRYMAGKAEIERSTIDNIYFPTRGSLLSLSAIGVFGRESSFGDEMYFATDDLAIPTENRVELYDNKIWVGAKVNLIKYFEFTRKKTLSIGVNIDGVYTTFPDMYSHVGRQMMMPAYQPIQHMQMVYMPEYSAPRYLGVGVTPSVKLWRELSLRLGAYAMMRDKFNTESSSTEEYSGLEVEHIMQASLTYNTQAGPLILSATKYGIESWNNTYLTFTFGYTIFAPKGTFY